MKPSDYHCTGTSTALRQFTDAELAIVPDEVKEVLVFEAKIRFPRNAKLAANAMIGAIALILAAEKAEKEKPS